MVSKNSKNNNNNYNNNNQRLWLIICGQICLNNRSSHCWKSFIPDSSCSRRSMDKLETEPLIWPETNKNKQIECCHRNRKHQHVNVWVKGTKCKLLICVKNVSFLYSPWQNNQSDHFPLPFRTIVHVMWLFFPLTWLAVRASRVCSLSRTLCMSSCSLANATTICSFRLPPGATAPPQRSLSPSPLPYMGTRDPEPGPGDLEPKKKKTMFIIDTRSHNAYDVNGQSLLNNQMVIWSIFCPYNVRK